MLSTNLAVVELSGDRRKKSRQIKSRRLKALPVIAMAAAAIWIAYR